MNPAGQGIPRNLRKNKAVGAGDGPGSDLLDRVGSFFFCRFLQVFFRSGAWRSKIGSPVRLDDFWIVDALATEKEEE